MSGPAIPKNKPIRMDKLREAAKDAPRCFACGMINDGTVVGCHPNGLRFQKGMGQKGHDLLSYACHSCHSLMDGRSGTLSKKERDEMWLDAFFWSTVWLIQEGILK